jgi:TonB-dependent SusC/RagA subfamily outer membrane receptor
MSRSAIVSRLAAVIPVAGLLLAACHHGPNSPSLPRAGAVGDSVQVGYGTQPRRDVTGAISTVDGSTVREATATSMADMLEGRVPGLEVRRLTSGVSLRIRGVRSLMKDGEPLVVVDGIAMSSTQGLLADMDPRDVRSVEVLKDAGSLAAYGSRGANGVLLITTRRPRS